MLMSTSSSSSYLLTTSLILLIIPLLSSSSPSEPPVSCPERCLCRDTTVSCSKQELGLVPQHYPLNTTILDLSHNRLHDGSWRDLDSVITSLPSLTLLKLKDNIFTSLPKELRRVKIDLSGNPLHCDCATLELPNYQFLLDPEQVKCASTSNPNLHDVYLFNLSRNLLKCDDKDLMVPAEVTLYKTGNRQEISCSKPKHGTVLWYRYGELLFETSDEDCSLSIRFMNNRKTGLYEVRYETPFDNKTLYVKVFLEEESFLPVIDVRKTLVEVPKKGTSKLTCKATGSPPPVLEWFFGGKSVAKIIDDSILLVDQRTIIVTDITTEQVFTCRASNFVGFTEANFAVRPVDGSRGAVFEWLAPLSVALLVITGAGSAAYYFYSKHKLAVLKERCASPAVSSTAGTVFENSEAYPSTIAEGDGYKMITISTTSPPHQFICPITRDCMKNPVVASDGFSYEEKAILAWFRRNGTSPMTNGEINKRLIQNHNLRTLICDIMDKSPVSDSFVNVHHLTQVHQAASINYQTPAVSSLNRTTPTARVNPNNSSDERPSSSSSSTETNTTSPSSPPASPRPSSTSTSPRPSSQTSPRPSSSSSSSSNRINSNARRPTRCSRASVRSLTSTGSDHQNSSRRSNRLRSSEDSSPRNADQSSSSSTTDQPSNTSPISTETSSADGINADAAAELSNVSISEDVSLSDDVTSSGDVNSSTELRRVISHDEQTVSSGIGSSTSLDIQIMGQDVIESTIYMNDFSDSRADQQSYS